MYPLSISLCSLLTPSLKLRCLSRTSHSPSQAAQLVHQFTTKTPPSTTTYITPLLILSTAKTVFRIPSSCASTVSALRMMSSCRNAKKCPRFSKAVAIPRIYCRTVGKGCPPLPARSAHETCGWKRRKDSSGPDIPPLESCDCSNLASCTCSCASTRSQPERYPGTRLWQLYIEETGLTLRGRFSEHLRRAEHFNSPGHSVSDIAARGLRRCTGVSFRRKQLEMEIIF